MILEADWDKEARVWVGDSDEVPSLTTEAETVEGLNAKLRPMIPELRQLDGVPRQGEVAFKVLIRRFATAQRAVA